MQRRYPVTRSSGKKVSYVIVDPFLRFWFRFVAPRESRLGTRAQADRYLGTRSCRSSTSSSPRMPSTASARTGWRGS